MPSEYVKRQFHVSFQDDPVAVACRHITGLSTIVWGNDYPHAEGTFRSQQLLATLMAGIPDAERKVMVGGTLGDLLGFEAPVAAAGWSPLGEHRFDGRAAIVTGAGRGIGLGYARLLAARGARVVVNDLGAPTGGSGADVALAAEAVDEIVAAGGEAVADTSDVSTAAGAQTLVDTAVERFGRIDVLVNNAGIIRWAGMPEVDADNLARTSPSTSAGRSTPPGAWPHMVDQGYGRAVMTTSAGVFGLPNNTSYATAKGAVIGLTRSLTTAGAAHGIKVNLIAPAAMTRMAGRASDDASPEMAPDLVADGRPPGPRGLPGQR